MTPEDAKADYHDIVSLAEAGRLLRSMVAGDGGATLPDSVVAVGAASVAKPEPVPLFEAAGRVLAGSIVAGEDVPAFRRSTVDGYAVRAADTFGAGEGAPVMLLVRGRVRMGEAASFTLRPGETAAVPTGSMLPEPADAAVMVEHTVAAGDGLVEVSRPVAPGENAIQRGEDVSRGDVVLPAGRRLSAADLGILAALGVTAVPCRPRPRVAIIPTGDEVVPVSTAELAPGQVRDVTSAALVAYVTADGGEAEVFEIVADERDKLAEAVERAIHDFDLVLALGGSSVGARDNTAAVIDSFGPPGVLFHGLALKPGKPTIGGLCGPRRTPVFGLPGHPVSGLVVYRLLVRPALRRLGGELPRAWEPESPVLRARLATAVSSDQGREEYLCARLLRVTGEDHLLAEPVHGKSGLITMLARADGLVRIPAGERGLEKGAWVEVIPLG